MPKTISLLAYIKRRNGVPLGAKGSLSNMLKRSIGARSFVVFWRYWNPIWGYYLSRYIMTPLCRRLPTWQATVITFAVSGALHDIAVGLLKREVFFIITPWFTLMGLAVAISQRLDIQYNNVPVYIRAIFNVLPIVVCYLIVVVGKSILA